MNPGASGRRPAAPPAAGRTPRHVRRSTAPRIGIDRARFHPPSSIRVASSAEQSVPRCRRAGTAEARLPLTPPIGSAAGHAAEERKHRRPFNACRVVGGPAGYVAGAGDTEDRTGALGRGKRGAAGVAVARAGRALTWITPASRTAASGPQEQRRRRPARRPDAALPAPGLGQDQREEHQPKHLHQDGHMYTLFPGVQHVADGTLGFDCRSTIGVRPED